MSEYRKHNQLDVLVTSHYVKHVAAMTNEGLCGKGEIAEELAVRDMEIERLRTELKRIENLANCGSVDSWMSLSDEQKRKWFAVTLHVDSEKAKIIREQSEEIERLREDLADITRRFNEEVCGPSFLGEPVIAAPQPPAVSAEPVAWMNPHGGVLKTPSTGLERSTYTIPLYLAPPSADVKDAAISELLDALDEILTEYHEMPCADALARALAKGARVAAMQKGGEK